MHLPQLFFGVLIVLVTSSAEAQQFVRGDANGDGVVNVADPLFTAQYLFGGGATLCHDAEDANDDGLVDLGDPVYLFTFLFGGANPPAAPHPACGFDPSSDGLDCETPSLRCQRPLDDTPLFPGEMFYSGEEVRGLASHDLDADGDGDLISLAAENDGAHVLLNLGVAAVGDSSFYAVGVDPRSLSTGDLDGDGTVDLVAASRSGSGSLSDLRVVLGYGDGTFGAPQSVGPGIVPSAVAIAEVIGDSSPDLVAFRSGSNGLIYTFTGLGDGSFAGPVTTAASLSGASCLAVGMLDADSEPDVVMQVSGLLTVFPGNAGAFDGGPPISISSSGECATLSDVDLDGDLDLLSSEFVNGDPAIVLNRNNGNGTFALPIASFVDSFPDSILLLDVNVDGHEDVVVANEVDRIVTVLLGNSTGSYVLASSYRSPRTTRAVAGIDWNQDGFPDLASAGLGPYGAIHLGRGDGSFESALTLPVGGLPEEVAAGDWNGDGDLDFAVICSGDSVLQLYQGGGQGNFTLSHELITNGTRDALRVGDLNGDGLTDFVTLDVPGSQVEVFRSDATTGSYSSQSFSTGSFPVALQLADLNGDAHLDLVVCNFGGQSLAVARGLGGAQFETFSFYPVGAAAVGVAVGDVTGDGLPDCVVVRNDGTMVTRIGNGAGGLTSGPTTALGADCREVALADFDEDGDLDVAVGVLQDVAGSVRLFLNDGTGNFTVGEALSSQGAVNGGLSFLDINRDGDLDVLAQIQDAGLAVFLGHGNGTFEPRRSFFVGTPFATLGGLATGDVDGDGDEEVWYASTQTNEVFLLWNLVLSND